MQWNKQWNKKSASILAAGALLLGGAGAAALSASAQQVSQPVSTTDVGQGQTSVSATDPADAPEATDATEVKGAEADGPGGHQDPAGTDVNHQFDGQE